jgi:hypothetical protein
MPNYFVFLSQPYLLGALNQYSIMWAALYLSGVLGSRIPIGNYRVALQNPAKSRAVAERVTLAEVQQVPPPVHLCCFVNNFPEELGHVVVLVQIISPLFQYIVWCSLHGQHSAHLASMATSERTWNEMQAARNYHRNASCLQHHLNSRLRPLSRTILLPTKTTSLELEATNS